jgi:hypothetical protein
MSPILALDTTGTRSRQPPRCVDRIRALPANSGYASIAKE